MKTKKIRAWNKIDKSAERFYYKCLVHEQTSLDRWSNLVWFLTAFRYGYKKAKRELPTKKQKRTKC